MVVAATVFLMVFLVGAMQAVIDRNAVIEGRSWEAWVVAATIMAIVDSVCECLLGYVVVMQLARNCWRDRK